jgi:hypothetical protein
MIQNSVIEKLIDSPFHVAKDENKDGVDDLLNENE